MPVIQNLVDYFTVEHELEDFEKIHQTIEKDVVFRGTNLWILVFAIFVASIGLNMNSTAVIIGAMLISPLMGPINGMGYSIATYNFPLFRKAIKNFSFAVGASLVTSTFYFMIALSKTVMLFKIIRKQNSLNSCNFITLSTSQTVFLPSDSFPNIFTFSYILLISNISTNIL